MEALNDILEEYVTFCRCIGPWTDWNQGPGGNFSIKNDTHTIVKKSGAWIADTKEKYGWVLCKTDELKKACQEGRENIADLVVAGEGKPSIEAFLHSLPNRMIMHGHPLFLMGDLCSSNKYDFQVPGFQSVTIPYYKPGVALARAVEEVWTPSISFFFLKNHGVLVMGNTMEEILQKMVVLKSLYPSPGTDIFLISDFFSAVKDLSKREVLIRPLLHMKHPYFNERLFLPYTPDIAVFLQPYLISFESGTKDVTKKLEEFQELAGPGKYPSIICTHQMIYVVGQTIENCLAIQEVLYSYFAANQPNSIPLSAEEMEEIVGWEKEKERKVGGL